MSTERNGGQEAMNLPRSGARRAILSPRVRLGVAVGLIAMLWMVVLPWLAQLPRMRERLKWLEEQGIDASARYYTELEMMKPLLRRLEGRETPGDGTDPG